MTQYSEPIMSYFREGGECNTLSPLRPKIEKLSEINIVKQLEEISNVGIELTITFRSELQNRYRPGTLVQLVQSCLDKYRLKYIFKVILIGEISKTGIFHLHGSINGEPKLINILRRKLPQEFGRTEIKAIKYVQSWIKYVLKDEYTGEQKDLSCTDIVYI